MRRIRRRVPRPFSPFRPSVFLISRQTLVWFAVALGSLGLVWLIFFSDLFHIKSITCEFAGSPCGEDVTAELEKQRGKNILTVRADTVEKKLQEGNLQVGRAQAEVTLPDTLSVVLTPRDAIFTAAVATDSAQFVFIDQSSVPFRVQDNQEPPAEVISPAVSSLSLGEYIRDPGMLASLALADSLKRHFVSFRFILKTDDRLQVVLKNGVVALLPTTDSINQKVASLQLILSQTTITPLPKEIDLRFEKPVLRY